jgi:hypothetical protein
MKGWTRNGRSVATKIDLPDERQPARNCSPACGKGIKAFPFRRTVKDRSAPRRDRGNSLAMRWFVMPSSNAIIPGFPLIAIHTLKLIRVGWAFPNK